ncbi:MAG: ATP-binding cassette domain-containing protein [Alphaproteobacteria bacterium]|nr:ATP-binding cassette domain-containing protein [Alphaproteobacteria bacterium]
MQPFRYRISGLQVASAFELPGAIPAAAADVVADVQVALGPVPTALQGGDRMGPNWDMVGEDFLLEVPSLGRFHIRGGREIVIALDDGASERDASAYVLGTAFGILLHQRGALVLHGSAVAHNGQAVAICGHSGAGKSTLAAALCREGCGFVTDDLCAISLDHDAHPVILPDGRQLKLWQEAIEKLELTERRGEAVMGRFEKYFLAPQDTVPAPLRLRAIYLLRDARPPLVEGIEEVSLADAMHALDREAYRPGLRIKMGARPGLVMQSAQLLAHVNVFRLTRPHDFAKLPQTVRALRAHWDALAP